MSGVNAVCLRVIGDGIGLGNGVNDADGFAAVALIFEEFARHAAVERVDRGVEDASSGIEVMRAEGVRIARKTGTGVYELGGTEVEIERRLVRLQRFVNAVSLGRSVIRATVRSGAGVRPGSLHREEFGELRPGGNVGIEPRVGCSGRVGEDRGEEPPRVGEGHRPTGIGEQGREFAATEFDRGLVDQSLGGGKIHEKRGARQPTRVARRAIFLELASRVKRQGILI